MKLQRSVAIALAACIAVLSLALSACGQKGPLRLADTAAAAASAASK